MNKTAKDYIEIIYSSSEDLSDEDKIQRKKDEQILTNFLEQFKEKCNEFSDARMQYTDNEFYKAILDMIKKEYDPETIIVNYVEKLLEAWETNIFATQKTDELIALINFGNRKRKVYEDIPEDNTSITLEQVYELTEEFLKQIDFL